MKTQTILLIFLLCGITAYSGSKTYLFTYDPNGNRLTVAFSSTCRTSQADSLQADSTDQTALKDIIAVKTLSAYPNPARDYFILSFPELLQEARLELIGLNGEVVYRDDQVNTLHTVIKTCDLAAGLYTLIVHYGNEKPFVQKIVKP